MLKSLQLENFTVFPSIHFDLSTGINAFLGENGSGKTHLLKVAYCLDRAWSDLTSKPFTLSKKRADVYFGDRLVSLFQTNLLNLIRRGASECRLIAQIDAFIPTVKIRMPYENPWQQFPFGNGIEELSWQIVINGDELSNQLDTEIIPESAAVNTYQLKSIFLPSKEIVSFYDGLAGLLERYEIKLDATYRDLLPLINSPELSHLPDWFDDVFAELEDDLGVMKLEKTSLVFVGKDGVKTEAPMMAEGFRKLSLLMYLVRHGAIEEKGGSIYWDEPEANLNPRLIAKLAKILVALASHGIQVNIATHSLFFLKEIDLQLKIARATNKVPARFFALYDTNKGIQVSVGDSLEEIEPIVALDMEIDQADRYNEWFDHIKKQAD
ncbi:MAG: AAA family ATPase [Candidatus Methylumidiphilus sp.]